MSKLSELKEAIKNIKSQIDWVIKEVNELEVVDGEADTSGIESEIADTIDSVEEALSKFEDMENEFNSLEELVEEMNNIFKKVGR